MSDADYYSLIDTVLDLYIEQLETNFEITNSSARLRVIKTLTKLRIETLERLNS